MLTLCAAISRRWRNPASAGAGAKRLNTASIARIDFTPGVCMSRPEDDRHDSPDAAHLPSISRREMLAVGIAGSVMAGAPLSLTAENSANDALKSPIELTVNGQLRRVEVDNRTSLLDLIREHLHLFGAKKGCDHGQCGACTVHVEGRRVASCLTLAVQMSGRQVTTIEGIGAGRLHPMQQAFIEQDALQCGYCTPGQIMAAIACVKEGHASSREEIREYMSGNLCRCGAYVGIIAAIDKAAPMMRDS
jgi:xanthine dehydrogenase YagT iron-sulfur-binding subunit